MKRYILAGLIFCYPYTSTALDIQLTVNGRPDWQTMCAVSCPSQYGFPSVPITYPCHLLPALEVDCSVIIQTATEPEKVTLVKVIEYLQILICIREERK